MNTYITLINKIEASGQELFWHGPASESEIRNLESLLAATLPNSFKEFLENYGGGGVIDSEISGIEDNDASADFGGTVYGDTLTVREDYDLPDHLVVIYFKEDETCWCIDTSTVTVSGESPVVSYSLTKRSIDNTLAPSFSDFFLEYLRLRAQ